MFTDVYIFLLRWITPLHCFYILISAVSVAHPSSPLEGHPSHNIMLPHQKIKSLLKEKRGIEKKRECILKKRTKTSQESFLFPSKESIFEEVYNY